jgi:predicted DNA-binding transcriptional regulator YafY
MEQTLRVNMAMELLRKKATSGEVVSSLIARFNVSSRQAHRYLQRAQKAAQPLSFPESKEVFTVRLSPGLIREIRSTARRRNQRISDLATEALRTFIQEKTHG